MLISVDCPVCGETHRVHQELRGKSIRCQRRGCRGVILVDDQPPKRKPAPTTVQDRGSRKTGRVGDVIPLESAEPIDEVQRIEEPPVAPHVADMLEMLPSEAADAQAMELDLEQLPPDSAVPPPRARSRGKKPQVPEAPRVVEAGHWDAPPVRRPTAPSAPSALTPVQPEEREAVDELEPVDAIQEPTAREETAEDRESEPLDEPMPRRRGRLAKWIVTALLTLTIGGLGGLGVLVYLKIMENEETVAGKADEEFDKGQFRAAGGYYEKLAGRFRSSENLDRYKFRKELSDLRHRLSEPSDDLGEEFDHVNQFLDDQGKSPQLPVDGGALAKDLARVLIQFAERSAKDVKDEEPLKTLVRAKPVMDRMKAVKLKDKKGPDWSEVDRAFDGLKQSVARMMKRREILDQLRAIAKKGSFAGIVELENKVKEHEAEFPDLPADAEVVGLFKKQRAAHLDSVRFVAEKPSQGKPAPADGNEPSVIFNALLDGGVGPGKRDDVGLVLSRGVLSAVSREKGELRWARRVGVDTTALPVRVPARAGIAELILVLSSDTPAAMTALDRAGNSLWRHELKSPVLGRPVVIDQRAYLATFDDGVHEIELIEGKLIGKYQLGQQLTIGGTHEPRTRRIYFPASDGCVYILNVGEGKCERILYTRHPAGSLRGEPIVVPPEGEAGPGFLILEQADGLDGTKLRVFDLPISDPDARDVRLQPPATMEGWTWFAPHTDPEKLILLTDAGKMGLFGIKQAHNRDQALFPLLPGGALNLAPMLNPATAQATRARGRSEIVQVQGDDLWVLASDRLQRLRLAWGTAEGPKVVPVWQDAMEVGSPIHASQAFEDLGRTSLMTVTQPARRSCVWASHLDADKSTLFWRRQVGLVCQGEPVPIQMDGGADPLWLACDQAGALFGLDPKGFANIRPGISPVHGGILARSLDENPDQPPHILLAPDGKSAFVLACPGDGRDLVVRQVQQGIGRQLEVTEGRVNLLNSRLAGAPVLLGSMLLLPLADGSLARLPLPLAAAPRFEGGPTWRAERADPDSRCHIVPLGEARFLATDGRRGLNVYDWKPGSNVWSDLPEGRGDGPTFEAPAPVRGLALLPGETLRVAVADMEGTVTLVEATEKGALVRKRTWSMQGQVTAGPFVPKGGARLACVIDRSRLAWINPASEAVTWSYSTPGGNAIVGEPQLMDETLVVADASGRYVGLDVRTGKPVGSGHQLKGSIAPTACPVRFQKDRLLAPLSDGTLMLLGVDKLKGSTEAALPAGQ